MENPKEPFVGKSDRPEVTIKADTPISNLTVRDLGTLLHENTTVALKRFKELKNEKWEHPKIEKFEKYEHPKWEKFEKFEKHEKWENIKHEKLEKLEIDVLQKTVPDVIPDPRGAPGDPNPIEKLVAAVSQLEEQVGKLQGQIDQIKAKIH
jgi:hypothetical protein